GIALHAITIGDAERAAQREALAQRAQVAQPQLRIVAAADPDHAVELDRLRALQAGRAGGRVDRAGDRRIATHQRVAAEQAVGLYRQRTAGAVGDEADRTHRHHRQHQRAGEDADVAGGQVATQLPPGEAEGVHAATAGAAAGGWTPSPPRPSP